jgi:hypothetical protein
MQRGREAHSEDAKAAALTKAALEAARRLGLTPAETAAAIGVPQGALNAMKKGERAVDGYNGEAECADALVRSLRRLTALLGDTETAWRSWLRRDNDDLGMKPVEILQQRQGVLKVAQHLERLRSL